MSSRKVPQEYKPIKPLSKSTVVVTGGSRDIGGGIVLELAKEGAKVAAVFRKHEQRAQKIAEEAKKYGQELILVQADLTTDSGRETVFNSWKEKFGNNIDILVLCASGATMEINVDANMALIDKFLALRKERLESGETLSTGTIIFLQSEPGHYHRVIDGVFDFLEYYRTKVGPAKRAGEDALRKRLAAMEEVCVRGIVVCPPEVTDTFNMKLFEMQNTQAREKSRELSAMLGTRAFVTIAEVAKTVKEIIQDSSIPNGYIKLFGQVTDGLTALSAIYGDEAIYVHTFEKVGENKGIGRVIVNPKLWKRDAEPSFTGEIKNQTKNQIISSLRVTKDHMRGHFRSDIVSLFPGHKSIRAAAITLGRFLTTDAEFDPKQIYLTRYKSVKFRSPVLLGQTLSTKVKIPQPPLIKGAKTISPPFAKEGEGGFIEGDAVQENLDKESMDIRGMVVKRVKNKDEESVLLLDQLVESAAQTVGLYLLVSLENEQVLPLFHSTGEAEIFKNVQPGENLLVKAGNIKIVKAGSMNIFSADLEIAKGFIGAVSENGEKVQKVVQEELIATIKSLQGLLLPKEEALKKLVPA